MRVAIDISSVIFGTGVSRYTSELVSHLPKEAVIPFGFSMRRSGEFPKKTQVFPFPPTAMHYLWNRLHLVNIESLVGKVDVYHSSDWAQGPSRAKKVTTIHDLSPFLFPQETNPKILAVHTARMKWVVKECDAVICVSQNTASDLQKLFNYPASKIHVIYEALTSQSLLSPVSKDAPPYILAIGARQPRKNIERLIKSYTTYKEKLSLPGKLIILGESPGHLTIQSSANVIFTGHISDQEFVNYMAGATAFVYPSLYEGFGLPILEAFHYKIPVAASNNSSIPEVTGTAAALFDPLDEESIAKGISHAITNRPKLVALGTKQLTKFSWAKTAEQTLQVYESLL